ncbi:MAG: cyclase family protein [Actinobacteria bacterium]|nr:cyclase family protein [Actinomycetota bacterium]
MAAPFGIDWDALRSARVIDLAQGMRRGMPVSPNHPAYQMALLRRHGDMMRPDGGSAANEIIVTGGHVGTHIDSLAHVSHNGKLYGSIDAATVQSHEGFAVLGVETIAPILCRGVLLDVAAIHEVDVLPAGYEVTAADLDAAAKRAGTRPGTGEAALIRTGWPLHWSDPETFRGQAGGAPGLGIDAGHWLVDRKVRVAGAETIAFEVIRPGAGHSVLPVHRILLVESGIHIIEVMDLTGLAEQGIFEFLFIVAPLKLVGATGSPVRPLAVIDG